MSLIKLNLGTSRTTKAIKEEAHTEFGRKGGEVMWPGPTPHTHTATQKRRGIAQAQGSPRAERGAQATC